MNAIVRSRNTDCASSHIAGEQVEMFVQDQHARVLAAVRAFPGLSSLALAEAAHLCRYVVARRTSELEKLGLIEGSPPRNPSGFGREPGLTRCTISGNLAVKWNPKE